MKEAEGKPLDPEYRWGHGADDARTIRDTTGKFIPYTMFC